MYEAAEYTVLDYGGTPSTRELMLELEPREREQQEIEEALFNELARIVLEGELCYE